jgi:hypothetical protein
MTNSDLGFMVEAQIFPVNSSDTSKKMVVNYGPIILSRETDE